MSEVAFEQRPCGCGCGGAMVPHEDGRWFCLTALLAEDSDEDFGEDAAEGKER